MKHLIKEFTLEALADQLCVELENNWKQPFNPPAIIFSNRKTEQWFKQHILKKSGKEDSVLLNLNGQMIEQFVFNLLQDNSNPVEKLGEDLLRDCIAAKLISKCDNGQYYFETLNSDEVSRYLIEDGKVNEFRLLDFSSQMASLYKDYEISRPDNILTLDDRKIENGILKCWKADKNFFADKDSEDNSDSYLAYESWQRKIFNDVIGEGIEFNGQKYVMLPELYEANKSKNNGKCHFNFEGNNPVFVFGYDGIGQLYRNVLSDFAREHELYIFMQSFSQEGKNPLIKSLHNEGISNLTLWQNSTGECEVKAASPLKKNGNSMLELVQKAIAEDSEKVLISQPDDSISFASAVSKIREIEYVHSKICDLIAKKGAVLSDFLVISPDITEYKTAILTVFNQSNKEEKEYPFIPFRFIDNSSSDSFTGAAINIIFNISQKHSLSRSDFFELIRNPVVQLVRHISDEEISAWSSWVSAMNVYRDRKYSEEDWLNGVRRLLLAKITEKSIVIGNDSCVPYEDIESEDNNSLCKFADCVSDLEDWIKFISDKGEFENPDLDYVMEFLNKWLLLQGQNAEEHFSEKIIFDGVLDEVRNQKAVMEKYNKTIPAKLLLLSIANSIEQTSYSTGKIFLEGISFANFVPNRILPAKYLFIIGLDSRKYPFNSSKNMLDLREWSKDKIKSDSTNSLRQKNAFLCELMNVEAGLFISYVSKDLVTDEQFFQSSVVYELKNFLGKENSKEIQISIDEKRNWSELWTNREFRNKKNFNSITKDQPAESPAADSEKKEGETTEAAGSEKTATEAEKVESGDLLPDRVSLSKIKGFLEDPFVFQVGRLFLEDDEDATSEDVELEPVSIDAITNSNLLKTVVKNAYIKGDYPIEDAAPYFNEDSDLETLKNTHTLPDGFFGEQYLSGLLKKSNNRLKKLNENLSAYKPEDIAFDYVLEVPMETKLADKKMKKWTLAGATCWFNKNYESTKVLDVFSLGGKNPYSKALLRPYVSALGLIAKTMDDSEYQVNMKIYCNNANCEECITLKKSQAIDILGKIYSYIYYKKFMKCVPFELRNQPYGKLRELVAGLHPQYGVDLWQFFSHKKQINTDKDLGYTEKNFKEEWQKATEQQNSLILITK